MAKFHRAEIQQHTPEIRPFHKLGVTFQLFYYFLTFHLSGGFQFFGNCLF